MTPIYKIVANGLDLDLGKHLISLSCNDESGIKSDSCSIVLDDRDPAIAIPTTGANLIVYLGYEEVGLTHIGDYIVNEISLSRPPDRISIKAHAADFKSTLKEKISGSFIGSTIGSLVSSIASKHGLIPKIASEFVNVVIDHVDQTNESDMHLLTRLAEQYGAIAKPAGGALIFAVKGLAKSISGIALGTTTIDIKQVTSWSYTESKREEYSKVKVEYVDFEEGETHEFEEENDAADLEDDILQSGAVYALQSVTGNETDAKSIAKAALSRINKNPKKIQISTIGNPNLIAESTITLTGFKPGIPTVWVVTKAEHTLDNQGFRTNISGEIYGRQKDETT